MNVGTISASSLHMGKSHPICKELEDLTYGSWDSRRFW